MPFKSLKQRALFYHLKSKGKMDQATIDKWEEHTPKDKKLPKRVVKPTSKKHKKISKRVSTMSKKAFWSGFGKMAAEQYMTIPGGAPQESLVKMNPQGGVDPRTPEDAQTAAAAGLITLPPEVEGASCGTCMYFRSLSDTMGHGFCTNPAIKQEVTEHMHCAQWNNPAAYQSGEQEEADAMQSQDQAQQQAAAAPMQADPQAGMPPQPQPAQAQGGAEFSQPGQEQLAKLLQHRHNKVEAPSSQARLATKADSRKAHKPLATHL